MNSLSERIGQNRAAYNKLIILMAFMPYTALKENSNWMETDGLLDAKHHSPHTQWTRMGNIRVVHLDSALNVR